MRAVVPVLFIVLFAIAACVYLVVSRLPLRRRLAGIAFVLSAGAAGCLGALSSERVIVLGPPAGVAIFVLLAVIVASFVVILRDVYSELSKRSVSSTFLGRGTSSDGPAALREENIAPETPLESASVQPARRWFADLWKIGRLLGVLPFVFTAGVFTYVILFMSLRDKWSPDYNAAGAIATVMAAATILSAAAAAVVPRLVLKAAGPRFGLVGSSYRTALTVVTALVSVPVLFPGFTGSFMAQDWRYWIVALVVGVIPILLTLGDGRGSA